MLKRTYNAVYAAIKWSAAYDQATSGSYREAVHTLAKVYNVLQIGRDYNRALYHLNLLFGWLLCKAGDYNEALEVLTVARSQIDGNSSLGKYDRDYLIAFCNWNVRYAAGMSDDVHALADATSKGSFDFSKLENVTARLRREFPLWPP